LGQRLAFYSTINTAGVWELEPNTTPQAGFITSSFILQIWQGLPTTISDPLKRPVGSTSGADWATGGGLLNNQNTDEELYP